MGEKHFGIDNLNPISMSGINECRTALLKLKMGKAAENFFEGMACDGGCLNGALCIHHGPKNAVEIDKFGKKAKETDIMNSVKLYDLKKENASYRPFFMGLYIKEEVQKSLF